MIYPTLAHFRHFSHSFNYNIFPMHSIMQNKPNFGNDKMNLTMILIMLLVDFTTLKGANFFTPLFRVQGLFWCICVRLSALLNRRVELVWESTE